MDNNVVLFFKNWQKNTFKSLSELQNQDVLCDTLLVLDSGKEIPCHACVVAATIPFLKSQLVEKFSSRFNYFNEVDDTQSFKKTERQKVSMKGISDNILTNIVKFCYCGHIEVLEEDVTELLRVASSLNIETLKKLCENEVNPTKQVRTTRRKRRMVGNSNVKTRSRGSQGLKEIDTSKIGDNNSEEADILYSNSTLERLSTSNTDRIQSVNNVGFTQQDNLQENYDTKINYEINTSQDHQYGNTKDDVNKSKILSIPLDQISDMIKNEEHDIVENCNLLLNTTKDSLQETMEIDGLISSDLNNLISKDTDDIAVALTFNDDAISEEEENSTRTDVDSEQESQNPTKYSSKTRKAKKPDLECTICGKTFSLEISLNDHMNVHTGEKPYKCSECDKAYSVRASLKDHMKIHRGVEFDCKICGKKLLSKKRLYAHQRTHGPDWQPRTRDKGNYECSICSKHFTSFKSLGDHMNIHRGIKPYKCDICERTYSSRLSLKEHIAVHKNEQHICDTCGKSFASRKYLRRHINEHKMSDMKKRTDPAYGCDKCEKKYHTAQNLRKHQEVVHTENSGYICPACGRKCKSKTTMDNHYAFCTQTGKYNCDFCEKKYVTKEALRKHITWSHKEEMVTSEKYKKDVMYCFFCGKSFLSKSLLQVHENLHTGAQKFHCDICGKTFHSSSNLGTHKRNVHVDVPDQYQCGICSATTKSLRAFKRHQKLHSSNPEYSCKNCGKNYNRRDMLNAHLQNCGRIVPVQDFQQATVQEYYPPSLPNITPGNQEMCIPYMDIDQSTLLHKNWLNSLKDGV